MLIFYRNKKDLSSRTYDFTDSGFSPLPLEKKSNESSLNIALIEDLLMVFSSIFLSSLAYGMLMVMIAIRLEANVKNEILISLSTITQIGAGVIFSRFLPSFGQRAGLINTIYIATIIASICTLLLYKFINYPIWIITIYALGTSLFSSSVTRNTAMVDITPIKIRAMVISFGTMLVAIGNSLGPIMINTFKTSDNFSTFAIASLLYLLSIIPLKRLKKVDSIVREQKKISIWRYIISSPKIMFSGFSFSYAMSSCSAFCIIYGIRSGMTKEEASLLLSSMLFGTIFYLPIGYLCNFFSKRFLMIFFTIISIFVIAKIYYNDNAYQNYTLFFILFGCLSGIKLPTLVLISEKYKSSQRLAANSAFTRIALIGNIFGLFTTGYLIKNFEYKGLWISIGSILFIFLLFCLFNYLKKIINKEINIKDFSIFKKTQNEEVHDQQ